MAKSDMHIKVKVETEPKPKFYLGQIVRFYYDTKTQFGQIEEIKTKRDVKGFHYGVSTPDDFLDIEERNIFKE